MGLLNETRNGVELEVKGRLTLEKTHSKIWRYCDYWKKGRCYHMMKFRVNSIIYTFTKHLILDDIFFISVNKYFRR